MEYTRLVVSLVISSGVPSQMLLTMDVTGDADAWCEPRRLVGVVSTSIGGLSRGVPGQAVGWVRSAPVVPRPLLWSASS